jgi:hypothetical protein
MVAMAVLYGTRIRYSRLFVHLVDRCDLAGSVDEGGVLFGRRFFRGEVDLVQSTCVIGLVLKDSDQFKGSMATHSALGRWSLGARA